MSNLGAAVLALLVFTTIVIYALKDSGLSEQIEAHTAAINGMTEYIIGLQNKGLLPTPEGIKP